MRSVRLEAGEHVPDISKRAFRPERFGRSTAPAVTPSRAARVVRAMESGHPAYDADIEAALDTSDEMSVGDALRRRRGHKDKRSIARRLAKSVAAVRPPARRSSADDNDLGIAVGDQRRREAASNGKPWKRRQRRHSTPGFTLSDDDTDGAKLDRLNQRLDAMRRLPRSSRYAQSQIEIIQKAMDILNRSTSGVARSAPENDELSRLLAAVSL